MTHQTTYGRLRVTVADSAEALGAIGAERFARAVADVLADKDEGTVIIATGNSQLPFVRALRNHPEIAWDRLTVFHMDEYLGMSEDHPASFRKWLRDNIVEPFAPKAFFGLDADAESIDDELARYTALLEAHDPDVTVMGIGENGHLAFNDPPAEFVTEDWVKVVTLDEPCRLQQVGEGHFASLEEAPTQAVTLTIPALLRSRTVLVLVPEARKAAAVKRSLEGPVTPDCPGSLLQTVSHAQLVLDPDSAALLAPR